MSHLVFSSLMCSVNCPSVDIVIPRYSHLSVLYILPAFTVSFISSSGPALTIIYIFFFRPKVIFSSFYILAQLFIPFLTYSTLSVVAISSITTGILIFIFPYQYFTSSPMLLTLDVSAQYMMSPNTMLYFTTS